MPENGALKKGYRCRILKMNFSKPVAYVSSALNACQAFDILFVVEMSGNSGKEKETPGRKESLSKDMVIPSVPEASHVIYLA